MFWWILLGIIVLILLAYMIIGFVLHHALFGKRFTKDPIVKYYSLDMYEGLKSNPIDFEYNKGKIRGNIYYYDKDNYNGIVVFSHGMFSCHLAYLQEIEYLAKNGFKVIGFDYYGVEISDGKNLRGLGNSLACLDKVVFEVFKLYKNEKIFVMGHSWGGYASLCISKYHKRLTGVVSMSPFIKATNLLKGLAPSFLYPALPFFLLKDYFSCGKYIFENGINVLNDTSVNVMVIHSKDDHMVKYYSNTYLLTEYVKKENVKFIILNGKKHNPDYSYEAIEYSEKVYHDLENIDNEEKIIYRKNIDYQLMGKLDNNIMDKIVEYFKGL